ncbi:MAG: sulfite exporter TauE/SafE family protein [Syntrophaceae bacterium]|nr:sulfite exporter TauE/SafE family protein [Syntrophaceae bacterium]
MALSEILVFVMMGCGVGFLGGLFGVGGGFVMVPILILSYEYSNVSPSVLTHTAIGTSLLVVVFSGVASAYQHRKQGNVDWRAVLTIGFSSALTALGAARLAAALSGRHLRVAFAIIVMAAAIRMLTESRAKAEKKFELKERPKTAGLVGVGLVAGVVSALAGIGGGVVTVPMMYQILNMPLKLAIGTSSAAIVITALFSVTGYIVNGMGHPDLIQWSLGFVDIQRGLALALGTVFLARVGAYVSFKTHPFLLRKLFALFVILISIYILFK